MFACPNCGQSRRTGKGLFLHLRSEHELDASQAYEAVGIALESGYDGNWYEVHVQNASGRFTPRVQLTLDEAMQYLASSKHNAYISRVGDPLKSNFHSNYDLPDVARDP